MICLSAFSANSKPKSLLRIFRLLGLTFALALAPSIAAEAKSQLDLELYAELLEEHTHATTDVVGTRVAYAKVRADSRWQTLLRGLRASQPEALSRNEKLAFWINAYNILAIDIVAQNYPVESIKDIGSLWSPVWDHSVGKVGGRKVTLGEIEHEILRPMREPRIHAAIVCASTSCPSLRREPFRVETLDAQLADTVRTWLSSPKKGSRIDRAKGELKLSKIFDWFEEDWGHQGDIVLFVADHLPEKDARWLRNNKRRVSVDHFDYDWSVNAHPPR